MLAMLPITPPSPAAAPMDPGAVGRAFAEQRPGLVRYAKRLLGDAARAEDVLQDTFVRLMAQPAAALNAHTTEWLFTVCRHRALVELRRENRLRYFREGQMVKVVGTGFRDATADFKFAAAVAHFGMQLRRSQYRGAAGFGDVIAWASAGLRTPSEDPAGLRGKFVGLVRQAQSLRH
jgi:DNA-directed RNA polymerase specialized sigma24 family protein